MERKTLKILFYPLKTKALKDGTVPIQLRLTINGQSAETRIQRNVDIKNWDNKKGIMKGRSRQAEEINNFIALLTARIHEILKDSILSDEYYNPKYILDVIFTKDQTNTLLIAMRERIDMLEKLEGIDYEKVTLNRYENCYRSVQTVINTMYGKDDLSMVEVNGALIERIEFYLKTERALAQNTIVRYMKCIKAMTNYFLEKKILKTDPFLGKRFKQVETDPEFLTMDEIRAIQNVELPLENLSKSRDVFIFCCFTGLAFCDIKSLKYENIIVDNEGDKWIRKARSKLIKRGSGKCVATVPLLPVAEDLIEKYKNHKDRKEDFCFPVYPNANMNQHLKLIADCAGVNKSVCTHMARHTFATTVALGNKVDLPNVSRMLGHASTRMTEHYARVMNQNIKDDMKGVKNALKLA